MEVYSLEEKAGIESLRQNSKKGFEKNEQRGGIFRGFVLDCPSVFRGGWPY